MPKIVHNLNWRGKDYVFIPNGTIRYYEDTVSEIDMPICGADTETVKLYEEPRTSNGTVTSNGTSYGTECQCVTFSTPWRDGIRWVPSGECALFPLMEELLKDADAHWYNKSTYFLYFHNLYFDTMILFKYRKDLMTFARCGVYVHQPESEVFRTKKAGRNEGEYYIGDVQGFELYLENGALFVGTSPHFVIRAYRKGRKKKSEYVNFKFVDSSSFFRGALKETAKELKLPGKLERQKDLGDRDFRHVPDGDPDKEYFVEYAIQDARLTRMIGEKVVELHKQAGFKKIRVSSPGFAFANIRKVLGRLDTVIYPGSLDIRNNQLILDTYAGGRTGGIYHGKVEHITVADFASSYPCSMTSLPSFGPKMKYRRLKGRELRWDYVWQLLQACPTAFLRVSGYESDDKYPSIVTEHPKTKKLTPVFGHFENIPATGPEIYGGVKSGTLTITKVHEAVFVYDTEPVLSPFAVFATEEFQKKCTYEKGTIPYISAKTNINAGYGKLIQAAKPQIVGGDFDMFECIFPEGQEHMWARLFYETYAEGFRLGLEVPEIIQQLEEINRAAIEYCAEYHVNLAKPKSLSQLNVSDLEFAPSAVPGAASLITGIARARLRALIKCVEALYWDTDSAFFRTMPLEELKKRLRLGSSWIHPRFHPLQLGERLGDLDLEIEDAQGWFAGTKRYFLIAKSDCKKCKGSGIYEHKTCYACYGTGKKVKEATHGLSNLPYEQTMDAIRDLAEGRDFSYIQKEHPLKLKRASDMEAGLFVIGNPKKPDKPTTARFQLDTRMDWEWKGDHWEGRVKEWNTFVEDAVKEEFYRAWQEQAAAAFDLFQQIKHHGYIRTPQKGQSFFTEYRELPTSVKRRAFRKAGALSLDEMASTLGVTARELLDQLREG